MRCADCRDWAALPGHGVGFYAPPTGVGVGARPRGEPRPCGLGGCACAEPAGAVCSSRARQARGVTRVNSYAPVWLSDKCAHLQPCGVEDRARGGGQVRPMRWKVPRVRVHSPKSQPEPGSPHSLSSPQIAFSPACYIPRFSCLCPWEALDRED